LDLYAEPGRPEGRPASQCRRALRRAALLSQDLDARSGGIAAAVGPGIAAAPDTGNWMDAARARMLACCVRPGRIGPAPPFTT
jgi:hypothetical protein